MVRPIYRSAISRLSSGVGDRRMRTKARADRPGEGLSRSGLKNPLISSRSSWTTGPNNIQRVEDAGATRVALPSLFKEQIEQEASAV